MKITPKKRIEKREYEKDEDKDLKILNYFILPYIICQMISFTTLIGSLILDENFDRFTNKIRQLFMALTILYFVSFIVSIDLPKEKVMYILLSFGSMVFQFITLILFMIKSIKYYREYKFFLSAMIIELFLPMCIILLYIFYIIFNKIKKIINKSELPMYHKD
jgi:hypothetical protein